MHHTRGQAELHVIVTHVLADRLVSLCACAYGWDAWPVCQVQFGTEN